MTQQHSITPPPELVQQWLGEFFGCTVSGELSDSERFLATRASQWGADQELEACCAIALIDPVCGTKHQRRMLVGNIRERRRPQPPSLKEQSIALIDRIQAAKEAWDISELDTIRRALEQLDV